MTEKCNNAHKYYTPITVYATLNIILYKFAYNYV